MQPVPLALAMAAFAVPLLRAQSSITLLLVNGKIWTENPKQKQAQAIAIAGNRIAAVGTTEEILSLKQPSTPVADLGGHLVLPGFDDAHVHFYPGGANLTGPQLRYANSAAEFRDTLADFAAHIPKGQWITGGNWDHENWNPPRLPTHKLIDSATRNWPVFLKRIDGHMSLANSVALKLAGIDSSTADPPGGIIVRDAHGNPTGILKDAAQALVERLIPQPSEKQIIAALEEAQAYANAQGVTSVQDMSCSPDVLRAYQTMLRTGRLRVRVACAQPLTSWKRLADVGVMSDFGTAWLHIGAVKGFADGSLGAGTALFFQPYTDEPETSGIPSAELANPDRMWKNIKGADAAGLQIEIHAIGDKANHTILNFYERLEREDGVRDRRLRIEHAQHLTPEDIPRFTQLHVIASMQPYQCIDDGRWAEQRIGPKRAKTSYAFRSLLDSGATLAFGSDWDVAPMNVMKGIYAAVTRRTLDGKHPNGWIPEQKITVEEAVRAYTLGSAYASFDEGIKGSIEPGKLADLVVLSDDIFSIDPVKIADTQVLATIFNGVVVSGELTPLRDSSGLILR
jgi:hypothetical protein